MPRAVLRKGKIQPLEPLPAEWQEGTELIIEKAFSAPNGSGEDVTDSWMSEVEAAAAKIPAGQDEQLVSAVAEIRHQAKELARQQGKR